MNQISAMRDSIIDLPWTTCSRFVAAMLTSDAWSPERAHLTGRTNLHFTIAARRFDAGSSSLNIRFLGTSPDLRHPLQGSVELRTATQSSTAILVCMDADLDQEPVSSHLQVREAIASLAETLVRTIAAAAMGES